MRIKVPNQTEGEIVVTGSDLVAHSYPVAGDGTIDVPEELVALHILTTLEGAVSVEHGDVASEQDQHDQAPVPPDQPSGGVPIPDDLDEIVADHHEGE